MNPRSRQAIEIATRLIRQRYGRQAGWLGRLLRDPSAMANFMRVLGGMFSNRPVTESEVRRAVESLRRYGEELAPEEIGGRMIPSGDEMEILPRADLPRRRQIGDELQEAEREILIPGSSNVYSIAYQPESRTRGIMYVTYRHGSPTHYTKRRNSCTGKEYMMGHKPFTKGPTYAYYDVPRTVFDRIKAAGSTGEQIWHDLRICGSAYGHQYRYTLIEGAKVGRQFDDVYVPRKATRTGFVSRAARIPGRKQFLRSTLEPERRNFRRAQGDAYEESVRRFRGGRR